MRIIYSTSAKSLSCLRDSDCFLYVLQENFNAEAIGQRCDDLSKRLEELRLAAERRKAKLDENSAFLQFIWKADVVESWIGN